VVALLTLPLHLGLILTDALADADSGIVWIAPLMCVPALASAIARLILGEGFADLSRRTRTPLSRRLTHASLLVPVVVGLIAYPAAAVIGVVRLAVPTPLGGWMALVAVSLVLNVVLASGEEVGWRGYMVPRLVASGVRAPLLVSGLIWGLWHVPLYLWAGLVNDGPPAWTSTALMLVLTAALGYVLARLQLEAGTVWAPVALHVAWNVIIQTVLDPIAIGEGRGLWVGEVGVLTVTATACVALAYRARPWGLPRR
jgi:membrane protease YdiL (CAAX protease family)